MSEKVLSTAEIQVVTLKVAGQLFAIDLSVVDDVFKPEQFTKIPAARSEIAGILNLRGRIIVAIHTDRLLGLSSGKNGCCWPSDGEYQIFKRILWTFGR